MPSIEDWEIIDPQGLIYTYMVNMSEPEISQNECLVEVRGTTTSQKLTNT